MKKKNLFFILKLCITGGLLAFILSRVEISKMVATLKGADLKFLFLAVGLHIVGLCVSAYRWHLLLAAHSMPVRVFCLVKSYLVGMFFNYFLPSSIGGDVVRAYDIKKMDYSGTVSASIVLLERILGVMALFILGTIAVYTEKTVQVNAGLKVLFPLAIVSLIFSGVMLYVVSPAWTAAFFGRFKSGKRLSDKLVVLHETLHHYHKHKRTLAAGLVLSLILQSNVALYFSCIGKTLGFELPTLYYFVSTPVALLVMMLPITINGIGIGENIWAFLLGAAGISYEMAVLFVWIHQFFLMPVFAVTGGIIYMTRK